MLEKHLSLSSKKKESSLHEVLESHVSKYLEKILPFFFSVCVGLLRFLLSVMQADSQMSKDRQVFYDASLQYVFKIQEVQERKKFEFVEPVSSWITTPVI